MSFVICLEDFVKTSDIVTENLFVETKRKGVAQKKLADGLLDT